MDVAEAAFSRNSKLVWGATCHAPRFVVPKRDVVGPSDEQVIRTIAQARALAEEALVLLERVALDEIHQGFEAGSHLEAAEHALRGAVRETVVAERDLRHRLRSEAEPDEVAEILPGLA